MKALIKRKLLTRNLLITANKLKHSRKELDLNLKRLFLLLLKLILMLLLKSKSSNPRLLNKDLLQSNLKIKKLQRLKEKQLLLK